jgi:hypothetical protein
MMRALAYLNFGRWVVDCPEPTCADARAVYDEKTGARHTEDVCANGHAFQIEMPPPQEEARIVAAVAGREERDKGWFPKGHGWSTAAGYPTGQTAADLTAETKAVLKARTEERSHRREYVEKTLADLGLTVQPDGTVTGRI